MNVNHVVNFHNVKISKLDLGYQSKSSQQS